MRILGAARLSHDTDESTSIARQREQIGLTCKARGDILVHITEDTDVSGAVAPTSRDGLGPWLTDPDRIAQWDGLMVAKLDRLTRSLRDFDDLRMWCDQHGKTVISVSESIDLSTSIGRMFANLLAMFAQFEHERMGERRADAARTARKEGRWDGRAIPFGYAVNGGNRYIKDPDYAPVAFQMARDRLNGRSLSWIARKLTERGIEPRGGADHWTADRVQKILLNPSLNGQITSDGKILRGDHGKPLRFTHDHQPWAADCPECPILDNDDWAKLQVAMKTRPRGQRTGGFALTGVAYCECGEPLYGNRRPGNRQSYYRCSTGATDHKTWCGARTIPSTELEAEQERLMALPAEPASEDWEPAGITVRGHWASLGEDADRGHLLKTWGVRVVAWRDQAAELHVILAHGQPDGFEQATGLLLPHDPNEHQALFEIAGMLVRRLEDGVYEQVRDPAVSAIADAIRDRMGR